MSVFEKHIFICTSGKTCPGEGAESVLDAFRKELFQRGLKSRFRVNKAGCFDQCGNGPMVVIYPDAVWYSHVSPSDVIEIIDDHLLNDKPVARLLYDGRGRIV